MPKLTPDPIRLWLRERDWDYERLAQECNRLANRLTEDWAAGGVRNAVNGYDPVRPGRIDRIAAVTRLYPSESFPTGLTYAELVGGKKKDKESEGPKEEPVAPPKRSRDKSRPRRDGSTVAGAA